MQTIGVLAITSLLYLVGGPNDDAARQPLTVKHASAAEIAGLDVATHRFAAAGLTLPPLIVAFSDDPADCYGHLGIFDAATTPWTITVCSDLAFVPTHELAHAWLDANMDSADAPPVSQRSTHRALGRQAGRMVRPWGRGRRLRHPAEPDDYSSYPAVSRVAQPSRGLRAPHKPRLTPTRAIAPSTGPPWKGRQQHHEAAARDSPPSG